MTHLELALTYQREKMVAAYKKLGEFVIWSCVTIIATSVPVMFEIARAGMNSTIIQEATVKSSSYNFNTNIFAVFIFFVFFVLGIIFFAFSLKYDEYKEKYMITFIKIFLRDAGSSSGSGSLNYDTVAKNVAALTQEDYIYVMNCLFRLIPPNKDNVAPS